jgi:hypothetical protein
MGQQFDVHFRRGLLLSRPIRKYSSTVVFQLRPLSPDYPDSILKAIPSINGKGTVEIVAKLLELKTILGTRFHFRVICMSLKTLIMSSRRVGHMPWDTGGYAVFCDPLHLLKRKRYRWVACLFSIRFGADPLSSFSTKTLRNWRILPLVVFLNSQIRRMPDSLPFRLSSPRPFHDIRIRGPYPKHIMALRVLARRGIDRAQHYDQDED